MCGGSSHKVGSASSENKCNNHSDSYVIGRCVCVCVGGGGIQSCLDNLIILL